MSSRLRKTVLVPFTDPSDISSIESGTPGYHIPVVNTVLRLHQERQATAWASLVAGYSEWHQANYDERGNVRREQERESEMV